MATASGSIEHLKQRIKHAHSPKSDKMKTFPTIDASMTSCMVGKRVEAIRR
jgi:hypothetical protein